MLPTYQPSQTSGNDLLAYKGNGDNAGAYDSSGIPIGSGADSLSGINDMLKTIQQQQAAKSLLMYKQKIADRDDTLKLITDPAAQIDPDILEKDRDALEKKRQEMLDTWRQNPKLINDPKAFVDFQKQIGSFKNLSASSKSRNIEYKRQMQQIANEPVEATRQAMIQHLDDQVKKGATAQIDPYYKDNTFDVSYFTPPAPIAVGKPEYIQDPVSKVWTKKSVVQTPLEDLVAPFSAEKALANGGKGLQDIQAIHDQFVRSPFATNEAFLSDANTKIAKAMADNNIGPDSPNYVGPIGRKDGDAWVITDSPIELAKGINVARNYKRVETSVLDKDYQKQVLDANKDVREGNKAISEIDKNKAQTLLYNAQTTGKKVETGYMEKYYNALTKEANASGDAAAAKLASEKASASVPVTDAINGFVDANNYKFQEANPDHQLFIKSSKLKVDILPALKEAGLGDGWEYGILPKEQRFIKLALEDAVDGKGGYNKPVEMVMIRPKGGDINQMKMVAFYPGKADPKIIDLPNAVDNLVRYNEGFKGGDKTYSKIDAARAVLEDQRSGAKTKKEVDNAPKVSWIAADPSKAKKEPDGSVTYEVSPGVFKKVKQISPDRSSITLED